MLRALFQGGQQLASKKVPLLRNMNNNSNKNSSGHKLRVVVRAYASGGSGSGGVSGAKRTALYGLHEELQGRMVEFCGWALPIQYAGQSIVESHLHTRQHASLFDVSHMAQLKVSGKDRVRFLESLVPSDLQDLHVDQAKLSVYTNERGGIIDDTVIARRSDHFYVVVNAGCADKDIAHYRHSLQHFQGDAHLQVLDRSLLALQGPLAQQALVAVLGVQELGQMAFMTNRDVHSAQYGPLTVTRCGYTGEDGFEVAVEHAHAVPLARALLAQPNVKAAALGARDTLRLEAGLCLYGHDLNDDITPVEAGLAWLIGKQRRTQPHPTFPGAHVILKQLKDGVAKKRVGLEVSGPPAREGVQVLREDGSVSGAVTSGTIGPSVKKSVAMAYVDAKDAKLNTHLQVDVRGKRYPATVVKMPFQPTRYYKPVSPSSSPSSPSSKQQ